MANENDKNKSALDKVIMGAIIGTAIGSALGMAAAPKKGNETRQIIKEKGKEVGDLAKETGTGLFKFAKGLLKKALKSNSITPSTEGMKELPNEMEIIPPTKKHD